MNCAVTQGNWYGKEDGRHKPELVNSFLLDKTTAWQGVQAILTALYVSDAACFVYTCRRLIDLSDCRYSREAGDTRGQKLELAMLDSGLNLFWPDSAAFGWAAYGGEEDFSPPGRRNNTNNILKTKDGEYTLFMIWPQAPHFMRTVEAFGLNVDHPGYGKDCSSADRASNYKEFTADFTAVVAGLTAEEYKQCLGNELPGSLVLDLDGIYDDPQVRHMGSIVETDLGLGPAGLGIVR